MSDDEVKPWKVSGKSSDAVLTPELLEKAIDRLLNAPHRNPTCSVCLMDHPYHLPTCPVYLLWKTSEDNQ